MSQSARNFPVIHDEKPYRFENGIITVSENSQFEFKAQTHFDDILENLVAFSNVPNGGFLFIGIENATGRIIGANLKSKDLLGDPEKLSNYVREKIHPFPDYNLKLEKINDKEIFVIMIKEGSSLSKPFFLQNKNDCNVKYRYNGQTANIRKAEFEEIILKV